DGASGRLALEVADGGDRVAGDADVSAADRRTGAVGDPASGDLDVEHGATVVATGRSALASRPRRRAGCRARRRTRRALNAPVRPGALRGSLIRVEDVADRLPFAVGLAAVHHDVLADLRLAGIRHGQRVAAAPIGQIAGAGDRRRLELQAADARVD